MTVTFVAVIVVSLLLAVASRTGQRHQRAEDFFVASGQFGAALFFFLSVGETYSVGTMLGFPAGVVAQGTNFIHWFLGYILLAFAVGYFLNPLIWHAGRAYGAVTLPDLFRAHFQSRALELLIAGASIAFLLPLGVMQFIGLNTVFSGMGWSAAPVLLSGLGGSLAFTYIAISGIRAPAYVSVLKDILVLAAILATGIASLAAGAGRAVSVTPPAVAPDIHGEIFAMSTIILQAMGFCVVPQLCAAVFTARGAATVRRAQVAMPLYMVMFPFLIEVAYFAQRSGLRLKSPNDVFLAAARHLLPGWAVGLVMAGAALSALVVLTGICLAVGSMVTRNLVPGLTGDQQRRWSQVVIAVYLLLSIAGAARTSRLMIEFNNLFYFGVTQCVPGVLIIVLGGRASPTAIAAGLILGDTIGISLHYLAIPLGGCNPGLIGLVANLLLLYAISYKAKVFCFFFSKKKCFLT